MNSVLPLSMISKMEARICETSSTKGQLKLRKFLLLFLGAKYGQFLWPLGVQ